MTRNSNSAVLVTLAVVALLVIGFFVWQARKPAAGTAGSTTTTIDVSSQPFQGNPDAKVTVVAFEDFKCPACKQYDTLTVPGLESKYIATNKIKYVFVNFPFIGPDSYTAANAGECVAAQSNTAFFEYAHILYRAQKDEQTQWATPSYLLDLAGSLDGVDLTKLKACIDADTYKTQVEADKALGSKVGVTATPSVYVNGRLVVSATPDAVGKAIDAALGN